MNDPKGSRILWHASGVVNG